MSGDKVHLRCNISLGGFSGERAFAVRQSNGDDYSGVAPVGYVSRMDASPFGANEPQEPEEGRLRARVIRNGGKSAFVAVPDGEAIDVPTDIIIAHS